MSNKISAGPLTAPSSPAASRGGDGAGWIDWPAAPASIHIMLLVWAEPRRYMICDIDDCDEVYGELVDDESILTDLDEFNDCLDAGGHVWLQQEADVHCIHCGVLGLPIKATREAE